LAETIMHITFYIATAGVVLAMFRFTIGPTSADRTVALDTLTVISISMIALIGLFAERVIYLDVAMIYGILSFIGVIAIARYIEGGL